jgi:hypothetical protein
MGYYTVVKSRIRDSKLWRDYNVNMEREHVRVRIPCVADNKSEMLLTDRGPKLLLG